MIALSRLVALLLLSSLAIAQDTLQVEIKKRSELEWADVIQAEILPQTQKEYPLFDGQRIDLFDKSGKIAYEIDWGTKWAEGIGQALIYSEKTQTNPGLILLCHTGDDEHYLNATMVVSSLRLHGYAFSLIVVNVDNGKYWSL